MVLQIVEKQTVIDIDLEQAIKEYGQPVEIYADEAKKLVREGDSGVVTLIIDDEMYDKWRAYDDPEFRLQFNMPEHVGDEPPSEIFQWMVPQYSGSGINYYKFQKPIPSNIRIVNINFFLIDE